MTLSYLKKFILYCYVKKGEILLMTLSYLKKVYFKLLCKKEGIFFLSILLCETDLYFLKIISDTALTGCYLFFVACLSL